MRITSDMTVAGYPILAVRNLFRVALVDGDTVERVQEVLHLDKDQAQQLLHTLQQEGYVEPDRRFPQRDMCRTTTKGNALAMASAAKPISRATAEQLVVRLLERVATVNAEPTFVYRVAKVVAFGSYVSDAPTLGDADIALAIRPKYSDVEDMGRRSQERIEHTLQAGRQFHSTMEQVAWPLLEVHRFLQGRSSAISPHVLDREQALLHPRIAQRG